MATRQIRIFIKGKEVEGSIANIAKKKRQLNAELSRMVEGSAEYNAKLREINRLDPILDKHRQNLRGTRRAYGGLQAGLSKYIGLAAGAFAVNSIVSYGTALFNTAAQMEVLEKKARTVFAEALPQVSAAAQENASAMGLTTSEYIDASAAIGDLLVPMGFMRSEAADMSTSLVDLSGALSEWTGGQRSSTEVSNILSKALLGERESLKSLGISITEADVKARLAEKGLESLTGEYLQQAKAIATLELITEKSGDAQAAYAENSDTLVRQQAELSAKFQEIKEKLATTLIPVFEKLVSIANAVANGFEYLSSWFDTTTEAAAKQADMVLAQQQAFADLESELPGLLSRYEELTNKTELSAEEQEELGNLIARVGEIVPTAVTQIDKYGNALAISADKALEFIDAERDRLQFVNEEAINDIQKSIGKLEVLRERATAAREEGKDPIFGNIYSAEELQQLSDGIAETTEDIEGARRELARLTGELLEGPSAPQEQTLTPPGNTDTTLTPEQQAELERQRKAAEDAAKERERAAEREAKDLATQQERLAKTLEGYREEARLARLDDDARKLEELRISYNDQIATAMALEAAGQEGATVQRLELERLRDDALKELSEELLTARMERLEEQREEEFQAELDQQQEQLERKAEIEEEIRAKEDELFLSESERALQALDIYYTSLIARAQQYGIDVTSIQKAYQKEQAALQKEFIEKAQAERVEEFKKQAEAMAKSYAALASIVGSAYDLLQTAGLKATGLGKLLALTEIGFNSAKGVSAAIAAGAGIPFPANLGAIASGIAAVTGGMTQAFQILNSTPEVPQRFFGGYYDVTGETDGRNYNARLLTNQGTGPLPPYPVLLASERGPEYIIRNQDLSNPAVLNHVQAIENIRRYGSTRQFMDGGFTAPTTTAASDEGGDVSADLIAALLPVLVRLNSTLDNLEENGVPAIIGDDTLLQGRNRTQQLLDAGGGVI